MRETVRRWLGERPVFIVTARAGASACDRRNSIQCAFRIGEAYVQVELYTIRRKDIGETIVLSEFKPDFARPAAPHLVPRRGPRFHLGMESNAV